MQLAKLMKAMRVFESFSREKLDVALAYKIMKIMQLSYSEKQFYDEGVQKIIEEYALRDDKGKKIAEDGKWKLDINKEKEMLEAIKTLEETQVEAPSIRFNLKELHSLKLSVADLMDIEDFLIEEA